MIELVLPPAKCNCAPPMTQKQMVDSLIATFERESRMTDRLIPFHGMVDCRVKDEDWECCPAHPDPLSCPQSGCKNCRTVNGSSL